MSRRLQEEEAEAATAEEEGGDGRLASKVHRVGIPQRGSLAQGLELAVRETFFPDDPLRPFKGQPRSRRLSLGLRYLFPIFEWGQGYKFATFRSDLIAGLTIGSLSIPQDIGYSKLAGLPPIFGLYTSFVPPLVYSIFGVSRDIAIGPVAVVSILLGTLASDNLAVPAGATSKCETTSTTFINADCSAYREAYLALIFTATFFAGIFQAALGLLRLGFIVDFLSHAAIVGFMGGAAITIGLQQLKGLLGIPTASFTRNTDLVSVMSSVFEHTNEWSWETIVIGLFFLAFLLLAKFIGKRKPKLFWVPAIAPLTSVILSTAFVTVTHANTHGVSIVGKLDGHINPSSVGRLIFQGDMLKHAIVVGFEASLIALTEAIAIGRTFASMKNYHIDGNKEMMAFGIMNIVGSCSSCYVATGSFSRSAVNYNAGCQTPVANMVMSVMVLIVLLVATPLFHNTPNCILASIIINAVISLIDVKAAFLIWKVDKLDFIACLGAFLGVLFASVEIGLLIAVALSVAKILLHVTRPHTALLGNIPGTSIYRNVQQYPDAIRMPGIMIVRIDAAIYFSNSNYIRERILRWLDEEGDRIEKENGVHLQYAIIEMSPVTNIDTTGILSFEDLLRTLRKRQIQLAFANPGTGVIQKLNDAGFVHLLGNQWFFLTVGEAVQVCSRLLKVDV
ncbi:hypothetical protein L7F22_052064 [Adiantum nelumboides]|nr:hypothetical protein [Adiantum nelumboides]